MEAPKFIVVQVARGFWQRAEWSIEVNGVQVYTPVGAPVSSYVDEAVKIAAERKAIEARAK